MKNGAGQTVTFAATGKAVDARFHRQVLARRAGQRQTAAAPRPHLAAAPSERKQPGRRFGPSPKFAPHEQAQAPLPMGATARSAAYSAANAAAGRPGTITDRQMRQVARMALRNGDWSHDHGAVAVTLIALRPHSGADRTKTGPTPKRREASR